ncbi:MAG TPA: hypothetical protein VIK53_00970 [Verrucomicrobiae bacterium]
MKTIEHTVSLSRTTGGSFHRADERGETFAVWLWILAAYFVFNPSPRR